MKLFNFKKRKKYKCSSYNPIKASYFILGRQRLDPRPVTVLSKAGHIIIFRYYSNFNFNENILNAIYATARDEGLQISAVRIPARVYH